MRPSNTEYIDFPDARNGRAARRHCCRRRRRRRHVVCPWSWSVCHPGPSFDSSAFPRILSSVADVRPSDPSVHDDPRLHRLSRFSRRTPLDAAPSSCRVNNRRTEPLKTNLKAASRWRYYPCRPCAHKVILGNPTGVPPEIEMIHERDDDWQEWQVSPSRFYNSRRDDDNSGGRFLQLFSYLPNCTLEPKFFSNPSIFSSILNRSATISH